MALKTWIIDIKTAEGGSGSEAIIDHEAARSEYYVDSIIRLAVMEIEMNLNGQQYKSTEETKRAEDHIEVIAKKIITGESSNFKELRAACATWVEVARKPPAPPVMTSLFEGLEK